MDFSLQTLDQGLLASLSGRLDHEGVASFEARSQGLLDAAGASCLVLDLARLDYLSSEGLRALVSLGQKARARGVSLAFCGLGGLVRDLFDISGLFQVFTVAESPQAAFRAARRG
ncbi:Putative anti-sigma factor antagonist BtrV [Fundidesulfovibrio magnetotacticus]|uniref:Anti-sigma factor antagonist n=1 Tax=Fundidesulfovibrio magnetotacticus TaxID=2730080 RepID=A0A6V8LVC1_9BACT|nr:STAS domain-containing protein [Fundidesulfovibrio magnetotacticus]GFK93766.1 Putative anti-sigma factor antagonist BtrV [Fundidesulfovibrio magnetotacticus]